MQFHSLTSGWPHSHHNVTANASQKNLIMTWQLKVFCQVTHKNQSVKNKKRLVYCKLKGMTVFCKKEGEVIIHCDS